MASKAFPALVLLALVCGQLVVDGDAQTYTGGGRIRGGGGSAAGLQPPTDTATHGHSSTIGNLSIAVTNLSWCLRLLAIDKPFHFPVISLVLTVVCLHGLWIWQENTMELEGLQPWKKTRPSWSTACRRMTAHYLSRLPLTSPSRQRSRPVANTNNKNKFVWSCPVVTLFLSSGV